MWGHLRRALIHFLRDIIPDGVTDAGRDSQSDRARAAGKEDALAYAKIVEQASSVAGCHGAAAHKLLRCRHRRRYRPCTRADTAPLYPFPTTTGR